MTFVSRLVSQPHITASTRRQQGSAAAGQVDDEARMHTTNNPAKSTSPRRRSGPLIPCITFHIILHVFVKGMPRSPLEKHTALIYIVEFIGHESTERT